MLMELVGPLMTHTNWIRNAFGACLAVLCLSLGGCGAAEMLGGTVKDLVVGSSGQTKPRSHTASIRIDASDTLNLDAKGEPLSVVVRLYSLKDANIFLAAPYESMTTSARARTTLGDSLVDLKEVVVPPGGTYKTSETFSAGVKYLGVSVLFRTPDPKRWRYAFPVAGLESSGLILGLHRCAISVARGTPYGVPESQGGLRISDDACPGNTTSADSGFRHRGGVARHRMDASTDG